MVKRLRRQIHESSLAVPAPWTVSVILFIPRLFVDRRRRDGLFPWLATRWLFLENKKGEESVAELYLCVVCDTWMQMGRNQTVKLLPWFALRRVRGDLPAQPQLLFKG